jgi:hypothetical protein
LEEVLVGRRSLATWMKNTGFLDATIEEIAAYGAVVY